MRCANILHAVIDIFWESTLVFFVAYKPADNGTVEQPWLVQVTLAVSKHYSLTPLRKNYSVIFVVFDIK